MGLLTALLSQELPENRAWRDAAAAAGPDDAETVLGHLMERTIDFNSASLPIVVGSVADSDLHRQQRGQPRSRDRPTAGHRRHGRGIPRPAESRAAWPGRGHLLPCGHVLRQRPAAGLCRLPRRAGRIARHARRADRSSCRAPHQGRPPPPVQRPSRDHAPCGRSRWTTAVTGSDQQALFRAADVVMSTSDADIENRYWPPANET
jgi:hypothetical protein